MNELKEELKMRIREYLDFGYEWEEQYGDEDYEDWGLLGAEAFQEDYDYETYQKIGGDRILNKMEHGG